MEMLIFLNGILFACNVLLFAKMCIRQKAKTDAAVPASESMGDGTKLTPEMQWKSLLEYTGGVTEDGNDD